MKRLLSKYGRLFLALVGLLVIAGMVMKVGPDKVWGIVSGAGIWLPLVFALDIGWMTVEGIGLYVLYGPERRNISLSRWVQATLTQYATFVVVPVGRASSEVARAGILASEIGKSRAAAGAALMQAFTLVTNALVSSLCLAVVFATTRHTGLTALLSVNILATGGIGLAIYLVLRHVKLGGVLGRRFHKLATHGPKIDARVNESRPYHFACLCFCVLGRLIQTIQYGVIFLAVVGVFSVPFSFVAEGIQLVARSMGDAVPNQVGVTEGAFALAAGALELSEHPEKAISIALLGRVSNLSVAGLCALALQFFPKQARRVADESAEVA